MYEETKEQSAELLRMILQKMAQYSAPFNPLTYTVWYEYLLQRKPALIPN